MKKLKDMDPSEELEKEVQRRRKGAMATWNHREHGEGMSKRGSPVPMSRAARRSASSRTEKRPLRTLL